MTHSPTPEQSTILDFTRTSSDNLMIRAYAGTGKTTTLSLIDAALPPQPHLLLCFNKLIATEAEKRVRSTTAVRTFNSLGHRIWADYVNRRLTLNPKKISDIFRSIIDAASSAERKELWSTYDIVTSGVNLARAIGYIPHGHAMAKHSLATFSDVAKLLDETPSPDVHGLIDKILTLSIFQAFEGIIDFGDQTYMPSLFGGNYPRFPLVMVDEYQDLSPVNHAMVAKLCKSARQIGVGDEAQAIYGFRGAADHSMRDAITKFSMTVLPLSVSFRCPSAIVNNVHWRVPDFKSVLDGGTVETLSGDWDITAGTVICRNNAPLLRHAMQMLRAGHKVDVEGCDIGNRIIRILTKLGDESLTRTQSLDKVNIWLEDRLRAESKSAPDTAECMRVFIRNANSLGGAITFAKHIFAQSGGTVRFMTGHKSKGLEFDHVYHLDSHLLHGGQDRNLSYVIDTRTKDTLSYIQSERTTV